MLHMHMHMRMARWTRGAAASSCASGVLFHNALTLRYKNTSDGSGKPSAYKPAYTRTCEAPVQCR